MILSTISAVKMQVNTFYLKKKTDILTIYILYNYFAKNTLSVLYILQSTHHIPHNQHFAEIARHWMMFYGHKQCVQYNADGDG